MLIPLLLYCGRRLLDEQNNESSDKEISKKMKQMNKIVERFWRIWQKKYLINLRKSHNVKTSKK